MESPYDWVTIAIFAGLIVLYLQRSSAETPRDSIWQYLGAAVACAVADYMGNHGNPIIAIGLILATIGYVFYVLRPFTLNGDAQ